MPTDVEIERPNRTTTLATLGTLLGAEAVPSRILPWLLLLFMGSGAAALIYEIVWLQMLQLVIGLTNVSLGILLGTFMGGMCLGSLLLSRLVSQRHHPLRVYAGLELGIGVLGLALLFLLPWVTQLYTANAARGLPGLCLRGLIAAGCLLPPTILMGATLPAIARWVETTRGGVAWLGFFYAGNIAGAVLGCLLAGFYLLRIYDMAVTTYVAGAINVLVASLALVLASRATHLQPAGHPAGLTIACRSGHWPVYVAVGLSGMAALGAEVVWTRLLALTFGATVYTFSIILAVFLTGLGLGSATGSVLAAKVTSPRQALGICQLLLMGGVAWTALMISRSLPYWPINPALSTSPWFTFQLDLARCLWAVLPAACLWGASFPLALGGVAAPGQDPGRIVGGVYAANTVGAIIGALGFTLLVVPWLGTQAAQRFLIGLSALAAVLVLAPVVGQAGHDAVQSRRIPRLGTQLALVAAVAGLSAELAWGVSAAPWGLVAYGRHVATWMQRLVPGITAQKDVRSGVAWPDIFCTYLGEGLNGSVAVTEWGSGVRSFHSAGKVQASTDPRDMRLQRMLGHLSALAHPKPASVLVVACGAGITAGTFVLHPTVNRIVICDIEPLVPRRVAPMFAKENYGVTTDPRTEVISDDGRHFLRTTSEKFDLITSDPIDPWVKGCAALNTEEYYQICKAHLNPGGVMSLWIPLYESNQAAVKSSIATFFKAFPNGIVWSNDSDGEGYDAVLFGQVEPSGINLDEWQERLGREDHQRVRQSLREVGFQSVNSLLSTYAGRAADLTTWLADAQINTDRNLRLQYLAGMWLNSSQGAEILAGIHRDYRFPEELFVGSEPRRKILREMLDSASHGH